jgi:hypothetical protein
MFYFHLYVLLHNHVSILDALGRTRTCMRKDLKRLKAKDKDIVRYIESYACFPYGNIYIILRALIIFV